MKSRPRKKLLEGAAKLDDILRAELKDPAFRESVEQFYLEAEVAERLYKLRQTMRLTQKQLAARARMQQHAISRIESGANGLNLKTLRRVAAALGCRVVLDFRPL